MAISALTLQANAERSMSVSFTSAADTDALTFSALSALLPASAASSAIKAFLDAARGSVAATLTAIASNGVVLSNASSVATQPVPQVSADKTLAGFDAGDHVLRIALSSTISA
jgi:hypothetical protein